jgi:hypothetical protein
MTDAQEKLAELRRERDELASTRTREDIKAICERSLANAYARVNGTMASRYFLNETALPEHLLAVIGEFEVESKEPALLDFIVAKNTPQEALTDRQKKQRLVKLDEQIAKVTAEVREAAKAEALAAIEERFGGVAA